MEAYPKRAEPSVETGHEPVEAEIKTCFVKVEITDSEANPKNKETEMEQQEVPKEETAVKRVRALKKRYGERHLAKDPRQKPKKQTQGNDGSQKKFAATCRG
jgi:hypothetical protein